MALGGSILTRAAASSIARGRPSTLEQMAATVGAFSVETTMLVRHVSELSAADFAPAFLVVAIISAVSTWFFYKMPVDAGHQVSGRGVVAAAHPEPDAEPEETAATETANARDQQLG